MGTAQHYCADCDTHFGGPPNNVTPEEHADIAHDGGIFEGVTNGDWKDYRRKQNHQRGLDIDKR